MFFVESQDVILYSCFGPLYIGIDHFFLRLLEVFVFSVFFVLFESVNWRTKPPPFHSVTLVILPCVWLCYRDNVHTLKTQALDTWSTCWTGVITFAAVCNGLIRHLRNIVSIESRWQKFFAHDLNECYKPVVSMS